MPGARTFKVIFSGDSKGAVKAADEVEKSTGGLGKTLGHVAEIAGGFIIGEGIMKLPGFLSSAAQAAADDEAATARLDQAIENFAERNNQGLETAESWGGRLKGFANDAIDAGQKLAFSDDEVRDSLGYLLDAVDDSDDAFNRQKIAMDLARGANIPLAQATRLLGKMNEDNTNTLKKYGIEIAKGTSEADALAMVQARFGGQADKFAKSTAGQMAQAKIAISEIKEAIGYAVLPIFTAIAKKAAEALPAVQSFVGELSEKAKEYVVPALEVVADKLGEVAGWVQDVLVPAARDFLATEFVPAMQQLGDFLLNTLLPAVLALGSAVWDKLKGPLETVFNFFKDNKDALQAAGVAIGTVLVVAFAAWAVSAGAAAVATIAAAAPVIALVAVIALLAAGVFLLIKHWDDITAKYPIVGAAADALKEKFQAFATWVTDTFVPAVADIAEAVSTAVQTAIDFVRDHWDEIKAIIEPALKVLLAIIKALWEDVQTAFRTAFGIIKGIVDVFMGVFTGDWDRAWKGVKEIVGSLWDGIKDHISTVLGLITTIIHTLFDPLIDGIWGKIQDAAEWVGHYLNVAGGYFTDFYNMAVAPIQWVMDKIQALIDKIRSIPSPGDIVGGITGLVGFAGGVEDFGGGFAMVGERGPEPVFLPRGSTVVSHEDAVAALRGTGGGSGAPIIHFHIGTLNATDETQARAAAGDLAYGLSRRLRAMGAA